MLIYAEFFYLWYCHKVIKIENLYKAGNIFNRSPKMFKQMMSAGLLVKVGQTSSPVGYYFSVPLYPVRKSVHGLLPYTEPETLNGPLAKHYNIVLL